MSTDIQCQPKMTTKYYKSAKNITKLTKNWPGNSCKLLKNKVETDKTTTKGSSYITPKIFIFTNIPEIAQ